MNPIAITAGNGGWFAHAARMVCRRWNTLAARIPDGFECIDASGLLPWKKVDHPDFIKGFLWDAVPAHVDTIVWIDCDCFQVRPVGVSDLPNAAFAAVKDNDRTTNWVRPRWPPSHEVAEFFNAGVFIAGRESLGAFEDLKRHASAHGEFGCNYAQEWLNLFVARRLARPDEGYCGWHQLDKEWNWLVENQPPVHPIIVHLASISWARDSIFEMFHKSAEEIERLLVKSQPGSSVPGLARN